MSKYKKVPYERSFAYYIIEELGIDLDLIWNWELNDKNGINPYEITKSCRTNVWLYCLENEEHNYDREGNRIGYKIVCYSFKKGTRCGYCNPFASHKVHWKDSLAYKYPQVARMISEVPKNNKTFEDCYSIAPCSHKEKFYFKCLDCGVVSTDKKLLSDVIYGYSCQFCSDGLPITEKFMSNILKQLNVEFETHKSDFTWNKDREYDFYLPNLSIILETHGEQHYNEKTKGSNWDKLEKQQANDRYKKHLAKVNGIKRYYSVDCRYSELEYIKNNIIKTLGHLFDLSKVDWNLAWEKCQKSKCVEAWKIYNNITHDIVEISKILNLSNHTILRYLKRGAECGKCSYSVEESRKIRAKKYSGKNHKMATRVICITTGEMFDTVTEGAEKYKIKKSSNISNCCKGYKIKKGKKVKVKSAGKLEDGTKLVWKYLSINHNKILRGKDISKLHKINQKVA